ncbi:enoyl-CoA hydratase/isomerase family protein [Emcibacter sp.]|uniref:enoyl-CoA hydratase/isomerase family protein n=1 Tax=Emcibacter sp. TaxID=1979954 RepID=UPI002AA8678D|nr:enoyl-CoA hydratase-related protein [Emcibacter sp.]
MENKKEPVTGLELGVSDNVLTVRLDREKKRNSITYDMYDAITEALRMAEAEDEIRAVLFTASGSIFTAGHDVGGFSRGLDLAYDEKPSYSFMQTLSRFPKPVVAAVNGDAVGIGATLLLHCDLVYAVPDCRIIFPFIKMGLVPEFASTYFLPRLLGYKKAMSLFLREGGCSAEQALEWGIFNELVPSARLQDYVADVLKGLVKLSPDAVMQTKQLAKMTTQEPVQATIAEEARVFHELLGSDFVLGRLETIQQKISGK